MKVQNKVKLKLNCQTSSSLSFRAGNKMVLSVFKDDWADSLVTQMFIRMLLFVIAGALISHEANVNSPAKIKRLSQWQYRGCRE